MERTSEGEGEHESNNGNKSAAGGTIKALFTFIRRPSSVRLNCICCSLRALELFNWLHKMRASSLAMLTCWPPARCTPAPATLSLFARLSLEFVCAFERASKWAPLASRQPGEREREREQTGSKVFARRPAAHLGRPSDKSGPSLHCFQLLTSAQLEAARPTLSPRAQLHLRAQSPSDPTRATMINGRDLHASAQIGLAAPPVRLRQLERNQARPLSLALPLFGPRRQI